MFFAALATAAAGVIFGDSSLAPSFEQPTAPPARTSAASAAPVVLRRTDPRTEIFMVPPKELMSDSQTGRERIPEGLCRSSEFLEARGTSGAPGRRPSASRTRALRPPAESASGP
ncbi:hypothetical protein GCM10010306_089110 [Streptomyces umbrinus]|nr:hypothetical protein GCM10010306_089110 [Streptomyces umbrinus]